MLGSLIIIGTQTKTEYI